MADYTDYITQGALRRGLDPNMALHTVRTEGGTSGFDIGDSGTSFGPFQLHVAGTAPGTTASGLGDSFRRETGLDPSNPANVYHTIDYALDYAQQHGGFSPDIWHGLRTGYQEGYRAGEPRHGGTYLGEIHPEGLSVGGALLLNNLLQQQRQRQEAADKDTGNPLLNSIIQQSLGAQPAPPQAQPFDTRALQQAVPPPQPPATVPELASAQVPQAPPMQQIAAPSAPPAAAPTPSAPPVQPAPVPQTPVIQPSGRTVEAGMLPDIDWSKLGKTGNALLDSLLKIIPDPVRSTIDSDKQRQFQAGFGAALGEDLRRLRDWAYPTAPQASKPGTALARILSGIGDVPPPTTDVQQAAQEQQRGPDPLEIALLGQQQPMSIPERITAMGEAVGPYMMGGAVEGGGVALGSGPIIRRGEPPPLSETPKIPVAGGVPEAGAAVGGGRVPPRVPGAEMGASEGGGPPGRPPEPPAGKMPPANPMPPPPGIKAEAQELDDDLFKSAQSAEADRLEAQHIVDKLSDELKGEADTRAYHERESRMMGKPIPPSATTKEIETALKPLDDQIHEDATWIREHAPDLYGELPEKPLRTAEEGHVHRKVVGMRPTGERLDPAQGDIITGLPGGSLSRRASGMMHRSPDFVLEDNQGNRIWGQGAKVGQKGGPARYGESFVNPNNGVRYTVKEPTTAEITANTGRRYVESLVANTIDNYLRLSRVRRNIEILEKWKQRLFDAGHWVPEGSQADIPRGWHKVDIPQIRGYADPRIAGILNDIYRVDRGDVLGMLEKVNKTIIGSLFVLPIRHQLNVAAHYAVGRGFDWVYRNPMLARAYTEVATQGPNYLRYLREGAGMRYASTLNENFYNTLLSKLFHDQMTDPEWQGIFKELGHKAADVVKAEYAWSRRALWKVNDVFLTARIMELERAGKPLKEAIRIAEQEIPNYRLPTNPKARKFLQSPIVVFGRYGYGRARALAKTVENLVGPHATGEERLRALAQALILTAVGYEGYKMANVALQTMQQQLFNALGPVWGPRIAGDPRNKPLQVSGIGPFGVVRDTAQFVGSLMGLNEDQKNWAMLLGSWLQPSPITSMGGTLIGGRDPFTGQQVIDPRSSPLGKGIQATEYVLGQLAPLEMALQSLRKGLIPGVGGQFGVTQKYPGPPASIQRMQTRQAGKREAKDPIEQFIRRFLPGSTTEPEPPAAPAPSTAPAPRSTPQDARRKLLEDLRR